MHCAPDPVCVPRGAAVTRSAARAGEPFCRVLTLPFACDCGDESYALPHVPAAAECGRLCLEPRMVEVRWRARARARLEFGDDETYAGDVYVQGRVEFREAVARFRFTADAGLQWAHLVKPNCGGARSAAAAATAAAPDARPLDVLAAPLVEFGVTWLCR
jgi:hypothetical protein